MRGAMTPRSCHRSVARAGFEPEEAATLHTTDRHSCSARVVLNAQLTIVRIYSAQSPSSPAWG